MKNICSKLYINPPHVLRNYVHCSEKRLTDCYAAHTNYRCLLHGKLLSEIRQNSINELEIRN